MKKLILGFALLTASLGAHASFNCSIQTLKPTFAGMAIIISTQNLQIEDNSRVTINDHIVGSIRKGNTKYLYRLNGEVECLADGQCHLDGNIRKSIAVIEDGEDTYPNYGDLYTDYFRVKRDQAQNFIFTFDRKKLNLRIECK